MEVKRVGSQALRKARLIGSRVLSELTRYSKPPIRVRMACASVTFEAGARTAWHIHPLGQTLIVTSGLGWAQHWGGPIEEIRSGDVVWFAPNEKHWHGGRSPTTAMTRIRNSRSARRKTRRVDGTRKRRTVSALIARSQVISDR